MARKRKYVVSGPHRVHETGVGDIVTLDPEKPETIRLLARGQIAAAPPSRGQQGSPDVASTDDGPTPSETEE